MQQFVRTVNTTEAFKMKLEHLEREYKIKLQSIKDEIEQKERELGKLEAAGVGGQLGGGFLRFLGWVGIIAAALACVMGIALWKEESALAVLFFTFMVIVLIVGIVMLAKGSAIKNEALRKQDEAQRLRKPIEMELERLRAELRSIEQYYQDEMIKQKLLYEQHMLNQQELIEQEVSAIRNTDRDTDTATENSKECPQCAETVKLRAKICRFCGHHFE
jgi:predicted RNA-binding Zn-ribbon protein involved in translation (DUF1610 family)